MTVPNEVNGGKSVTSLSSEAAAPAYLKAKIRIGSCKGPISYSASQQVFHHDDIPEARRARKEEVREWAKSNTLSFSRSEWNKSSQLKKSEGYGYPICERRQAENMVRDRSLPYNYNYRAETLDYAHVSAAVDQPGKFHISRTALNDIPNIDSLRLADRVQRGYFKRTQEMPTHPNILDKTAWNISTQLTVEEKKKGLDAMTSKSRASTAKVNKRLNFSSDYQRPLTQQLEISNTVRNQKEAGIFVGGPKGTFNGHHVMPPGLHQLPTSTSPARARPPGSPASTASAAGSVRGKAELTVGNKSRPSTRASTAGIEKNAVSTKNRYAIEPSRKYTTTKHSGVWEYSKADGCMMWSDTGSFVYDSRGDTIKVHNPDALNLEGPTLAKVSKAPPRTWSVDHR